MKPILIIQFRTDQTIEHEQLCFREEYADYDRELVFVSAVTDDLSTIDPTDYAGVLMGGSGEFYLTMGAGKGTWREPTFAFIERVLAADVPMLGICFGFQMLGLSQGTHITDDVFMRETGTFATTTLAAAADDPLFKALPHTFSAQYGHKDTLIDYPDHLIPLSKTNQTDANAFRVFGKQVWGILFHPELNKDRMKKRFAMFPSYAQDGKTSEEMLLMFEDTPDAAQVLHHFMKIIDAAE